VTGRAGVSAAEAATASSTVPGIFAPYPIGDRRCMDGGVSGTGVHLDVIAGARKVLVLGLAADSANLPAAMTVAPGSIGREIDDLVASGTQVQYRFPEEVDRTRLMSADAVPGALAMGARQAAADQEALREFWA